MIKYNYFTENSNKNNDLTYKLNLSKLLITPITFYII